jgi:hypothetical protein
VRGHLLSLSAEAGVPGDFQGWHNPCVGINHRNMKTSATISKPVRIDAFSTSLSPVNHQRAASFNILDRVCCVSLFATVMMLMRLFLAK